MRATGIANPLAFIALVVATSCVQHQNAKDQGDADTLLAKQVSFPVSLRKLEGDQLQEADSLIEVLEGRAAVISIVDGTCMACIVNSMNRVDSLFRSVLPADMQLVFVLNVSRSDSAFFMRNLQPAIRVKGSILWDSNFYFERENGLFTPDINQRTFMVNPEHRIVLYGSPILNPELMTEYQRKLQKWN